MNIDEVTFEPSCPSEVLEKAKTWLVENKKEFKSTTNYAIFSQNGAFDSKIGAVCHRGISLPGVDNRACVATEIGIHRRTVVDPNSGAYYASGPMTWDVAEPYLRWFLYESYVGRFILNRDDIDFIKEHGIIVSADVYAPLMQNLMIMSRHFLEVSVDAFEMWNTLTSKGIDPRLAYVTCFNSTFSRPSVKNESAVRSASGHRASPLFNLSGLKNFMKGKTLNENLNDKSLHYRNNNAYSGGWKFFRGKDATQIVDGYFKHFVYDLFQDDSFRALVSAYRKEKQNPEMYRPPNPFVNKGLIDLPSSDELTYTEFFEIAVPYVQDLFIKKGLIVEHQQPQQEIPNVLRAA